MSDLPSGRSGPSDWRNGYAAGRAEVLRDNVHLRCLIRELVQALDTWADAKNDLVLDDLLDRARKAGTP